MIGRVLFYVFHFRIGGIAWAWKKQAIVTLSLVKSKTIVATLVTCQEIWMRRILNNLLQAQGKLTLVFYDRKSVIALSKNHIFHQRSKHINTRYHFIRELVYERFIFLTNKVDDWFYKSPNLQHICNLLA